jgi:enoyl-CoA hydratase
MGTLVTYERENSVATIAMDDGKVNVLSSEMFGELNAALDRAERDGAVVVLTGRDGVFSAGFDLAVLNAGGIDSATMVLTGFELAHRVLSFPMPVVVACSGHAIAMGVFLLLSGDYRLGVAGATHKITANEVAIGLTVPWAAIEVCRQRLTPAAFNRAVVLAEPFAPDPAVEAGFLDAVVPAADLISTAQATASMLAGLDLRAHTATKLRARQGALAAVRAAIDADREEFLAAV